MNIHKSLILLLFLSPVFGFARDGRKNINLNQKSLCETELETKFISTPNLKKIEYRTELQSPQHSDYIDEDNSSSFLLPNNIPSILLTMTPGKRDNDLLKWCSTYSAQKLTDGDPQTAWCEGATGDGIGEVVLANLYLKPNENVEIWAGFGKSNASYYSNNRPKIVKVFIIMELSFLGYDPDVRKLIPLEEKIIELKDINGFQQLKIPLFTDPVESVKSSTDKTQFRLNINVKNKSENLYKNSLGFSHSFKLGIQILSAFNGEKFKDTCISEIRIKR
jgi:hypothetical protein